MNIKDYIHYYIGHPCQTDQGTGIIEGVSDTDSCGGTWAARIGEDQDLYAETDCEWIKPILRRLEDMTEQEKQQSAIHRGDGDGLNSSLPEAHEFHYLLKQGFDLFGLIDAGVALDAKTVG